MSTDDIYGVQLPLLDDEPPTVDYQTDPPENSSRHEAGYHMMQRRLILDRADQIAGQFEKYIDDLQAQKQAALAPLQSKADWHASAVEHWHRRAYAARPREAEKTEHLPGGTSKLTARPAQYKVTDEEALRAWLEDQHDSETGERLDSAVFRREEKFMVSEIQSRFKPPKRDRRPEAGSVVPIVGPDGNDVPGVVALYTDDRWSAQK